MTGESSQHLAAILVRGSQSVRTSRQHVAEIMTKAIIVKTMGCVAPFFHSASAACHNDLAFSTLRLTTTVKTRLVFFTVPPGDSRCHGHGAKEGVVCMEAARFNLSRSTAHLVNSPSPNAKWWSGWGGRLLLRGQVRQMPLYMKTWHRGGSLQSQVTEVIALMATTPLRQTPSKTWRRGVVGVGLGIWLFGRMRTDGWVPRR